MIEFTVIDKHICLSDDCQCPQWYKDNPNGRENLAGTKVIVYGDYSVYGSVYTRAEAQALMLTDEWSTEEEV